MSDPIAAIDGTLLWIWVSALFVGAPLASWFLAGRIRRLPPAIQVRYLGIMLGIILVLFLGNRLNWSFIGWGIDTLIIGLAYLGYSVIVFWAALSPRRWIGIPAGILLGSPLLIGLILGTVGQLALLFIMGDIVPVHNRIMMPGILCRITNQGNATVSVNHRTIELFEYPRLFPLIERRTYREISAISVPGDPNYGELCQRAFAAR